ncbi:hypothetical protein OROMI_019966 [Orobanche minor]
MSGAARGGWIVATSIGTVEALKDQLGVCRWNYALRSIEKRAKNRVSSYYHTKIIPDNNASSSSSPSGSGMAVGSNRMKINRTEKTLKKVMDLNSWGPSTIRLF